MPILCKMLYYYHSKSPSLPVLNVEIVLQVRQLGTGLDYAAFCNELTAEKRREKDI